MRRILILHAPGGVRWTTTFDAQPDPRHNPWGILPWRLVGRGHPPRWGLGRMLVQKPLPQRATGWAGRIYPYLSSGDPAHHNVTAPRLSSFGGARLPSLVDVASRIAVVRVTSAPDAPFNSDHASASHTLMTGSRAGETGLVTAIHHALKEQLGPTFAARHALPAVVVGEPAWSLGAGEHQASRPIVLRSPTDLPAGAGAGSPPGPLAAVEDALDRALLATRQARAGDEVANLLSDRRNADAHLPRLAHPALRVATAAAPGAPSPALGALLDGTPVTNAMLAEVFALDAAVTPRGDIAHDALGALEEGAAAFGPRGNPLGHGAALAVRLLQVGAPVVSISAGQWDSHAAEVVDPATHRPHTVQAVMLGRTLAALAFVLERIRDPLAPGASLWDSTVVMVCSEFGRGGADVGENGFNTPHGENGGGSDHDPWSAWPLLGGPVSGAGAGGALLVAEGGRGFYEQNRIFTTLMRGMGIGAAESRCLSFAAHPAIPGLVAGVGA